MQVPEAVSIQALSQILTLVDQARFELASADEPEDTPTVFLTPPALSKGRLLHKTLANLKSRAIGRSTYTINTTNVTANSTIFIQQIADNSGIASSPTCNATATNPMESARVAATSFTFTLTTNGAVTCYAYWITN
jgi:hypothetical protein